MRAQTRETRDTSLLGVDYHRWIYGEFSHLTGIFTYDWQNPHLVIMNDLVLIKKESFILVGVTFERNLNWHKRVAALTTSVAEKFGFLFRARKYLPSRNLSPNLDPWDVRLWSLLSERPVQEKDILKTSTLGPIKDFQFELKMVWYVHFGTNFQGI